MKCNGERWTRRGSTANGYFCILENGHDGPHKDTTGRRFDSNGDVVKPAPRKRPAGKGE